MKKIKLTGREQSVLRAIDFTNGTPGEEILERTRLDKDDLISIINGLMDAGFAECTPMQMHVDESTLETTHFEVNPSYAQTLKEAMLKRF